MAKQAVSLTYSGYRWPRAAAVQAPSPRRGKFPGNARVAVGSVAKEVSLTGWGATWRELADLDITEPDPCVFFLRRYGDAAGMARPGSEIAPSVDWAGTKDLLTLIATAWGPEDERGISRVQFGEPMRAAKEAARAAFESVAGDLRPFIAPGGSVGLKTSVLKAYLLAYAYLDLHAHAEQRRCGHCRGWFGSRRTDIVFCSATCRGAHWAAARAAAATRDERNG